MNANVIGPLNNKRQLNEEWDEISNGTQFYYFKKGTYNFVTSPPAPRPGWEWYEIGHDNYVVQTGEPNFDFMKDDGVIYKFMNELCVNAIKEKFDIRIYVNFDNVKSFKEVFDILINYPRELFILLHYIVDKLNIKIESGEINKNEFMDELDEILGNFIFIIEESRFQIIKDILLMIRGEVNHVGPVTYQIPFDDKWEEFEDQGLYYYFRKGFYRQVEEVYDLSEGYKLCEICENKFIVCVNKM
jgi:hypothetical protein